MGMNTTCDIRSIVRVLEVVDTRQWEEGPDDTWYPVAGSGEAHSCCRCGRTHEIHVTVELNNGETCTVGTGCMKADEVDVSRATLANRAKRVAQLSAMVTKLAADAAHEASVYASIDAMTPPAVSYDGKNMTCGDGWARASEDTAERRQCAIDSWRFNRRRDAGVSLFGGAQNKHKQAVAELDKARRLAGANQ